MTKYMMPAQRIQTVGDGKLHIQTPTSYGQIELNLPSEGH